MKINKANTFWKAFSITLLPLFLLLLGLFADTDWFESFSGSHWLTAPVLTMVNSIVFAILYINANKRLREQMLYAVLIGIGGEYFFSVGLDMYTYRNGNVPHYIPIGHAIVLMAVLYFVRTPFVKDNLKIIEKVLTIAIWIWATTFLIFASDVWGFLMTALIFYLLKGRMNKNKVFFLVMYLTVVYLEIVGTTYGVWEWPSLAFGEIPFLPSANPPTGICLFYFGLDVGCLYLYKLRHPIAWKRRKAYSVRLNS